VNAATFPLRGGLNVVVIVIANAENGPTELPVHCGARAGRQRFGVSRHDPWCDRARGRDVMTAEITALPLLTPAPDQRI
jgi:hypothetical protein